MKLPRKISPGLSRATAAPLALSYELHPRPALPAPPLKQCAAPRCQRVRHRLSRSQFVRKSQIATVVSAATNGLLSAVVLPSSIVFFDGSDVYTNNYPPPLIHPTSNSHIAGYMRWGGHRLLGHEYPTDGKVTWLGDSRWWIIETVNSFNGQREAGGANFIKWFSTNAFGGSDYSNTPVGAVTHTDEPGLGGVNDAPTYFGLWASGKNFAICAWNSRRTHLSQAVGDPFVKR